MQNDNLKFSAFSEIEKQKDYLVGVSKFIHRHPEENYKEFECSQFLANSLKQFGFTLKKPLGNIQTAFRAVANGSHSGPKIGILAEYDALLLTDERGVSSVAHACGHNLNSSAALGAAIGVRSVLDKIPGSIVVIGTPAEEGGGGKIALLEQKVFDDLDVVMTVHGDQRNWFTVARSCNSFRFLDISFITQDIGIDSKLTGVNSLDAAMLFLNTLSILDYHLSSDSRIARKISPSFHSAYT
ncbi:MAG: M20/M25/M40 family metallo-hydrolase, partial [Nitrososphaerales archaeon]